MVLLFRIVQLSGAERLSSYWIMNKRCIYCLFHSFFSSLLETLLLLSNNALLRTYSLRRHSYDKFSNIEWMKIQLSGTAIDNDCSDCKQLHSIIITIWMCRNKCHNQRFSSLSLQKLWILNDWILRWKEFNH